MRNFKDESFIINLKDGYKINWKKKIKLPKIFLLKNISQGLLNLKKEKEVLKEKNILINLVKYSH